MTGTPLVTAILPSWNAASFIAGTLDSLDAQTWPALEILVGDDASTDETPELLRAWAATRPHVTLIVRDRNLGWVGNCNDLMARAKGEFLFFAFHDDQIDPDYVSALVRPLQADPEVVLAYGVMRWVDTDGRVELRDGRGTGTQPTAFARARAMITGSSQWGVPNRGLFRADAFRRIGGMKTHEAGEFGADYPWLLHLMLLGRFALVDRPLCTKNMRGGNLSRSWARDTAAFAGRDRSALRAIDASDLAFWQKWWLRRLLRKTARRRRR
ncbi:MAG TPA: glycosyltransferase family A protein [Paracoccaceae bacterium]|nr:glycosyltransferase family A protein [Paracoccaceae bacterium]